MDILSEKGLGALSLRETARRAGVSHAAPYRHFRNKEKLIGAIALEGFRLLTASLEQAIESAGGKSREELRLSGRAYVEFALSHPEYLKLMFSADRFPDGGKCFQEGDCIHNNEDVDAFAKIRDLFARAIARGELSGHYPPEALALLVWSQVHGLSHILIEEQIPPGTISDDEIMGVIDIQVEYIWGESGPTS